MDGHLAYMSKVNLQGRTLSLAPSPVARDLVAASPPSTADRQCSVVWPCSF